MNQIEPSNDQSGAKPWGKLSSFNVNFENVSLIKSEYSLGRQPTNDIKISDIRLSGVHCKILKDTENNFWVEDLSSNGTFLDNEVIGKGKKRKIVSGDKIYLLHPSKVQQDEAIGYVFSSVKSSEDPALKRQREDNQKAIEEGKRQYEKNLRFQEELGEEMKCCICIDYLHQCVTLIPCLHNFCASCFSDWMEKSKLCPQCREEAVEVKKNHVVNNIIEKFLENNPDKKRPPKEYEDMDKKNKIREDRLIFRKEPEIIDLANSSKNLTTNIIQSRRPQSLIGNVHFHPNPTNPALNFPSLNPALSMGMNAPFASFPPNPYNMNPFSGLNMFPPSMMGLNQNAFQNMNNMNNQLHLNNFVLNTLNNTGLNNHLQNLQNQMNNRFFGRPSGYNNFHGDR